MIEYYMEPSPVSLEIKGILILVPGKSRFPSPSPLLVAFHHILSLLNQHMGLTTGPVPLLEMLAAYFTMSQSIYVACNDFYSVATDSDASTPKYSREEYNLNHLLLFCT